LLLLANVYIWQGVAVKADSNPAIYFSNVGQGDSTLIMSGSHQILVDGGPDNSVITELGKVMPAWDRTIDLVVLTHPQADHLTGLFAVLERYQVGEVLATFADYDSSLNREWLKTVKQCGAKLNYADPADDYHFDDLYIDTLLPLTSSAQSLDANEDSIILRVSGERSSALLMGDAGFSTEDSLLKIYPGISADILRVGHHGSKYSSSLNFLERIDFNSAVISVGKNSYGHPSPDTLTNLSKVGAKIYRTDQNGTVKFEL
jgi:competence protein ComEC